MKNKLFIFISLLLTLTATFACNKLELPHEEEKPDEKPVTPVDPPSEGDTLSVAQVMTMLQEDFGLIKCYMVGYVKGTSIKTGAKFDLPDFENTNFLIADTPYEVNPEKCIAVKLEKTGKFACRSELNLLDHPDFLHKGVIIDGWISMYFNRPGIIRIYSCEIFIENDENSGEDNNKPENGDNENENGNDNTDNQDDGGNNTPSDSDSISIDDNEQLVPDGRNFQKKMHFFRKSFGTLK